MREDVQQTASYIRPVIERKCAICWMRYEAVAQPIRSMSSRCHSVRHHEREEAAASIGSAYLSQARQVPIVNLQREE